jgi:hypothetical protein
MASPSLDVPMNDSFSEDLDQYYCDDLDSDSDDSKHLSNDSDNPAPPEKDDGDSTPSQSANPPPEDSSEIITATEDLDALCSLATTELSQLPRATRKTLTSQTRAIFKSYEIHGSQLRLANALEKFLLAPASPTTSFAPSSPPMIPAPIFPRSNDAESGDLIRTLPFHPADLKLEISGDVTIPPYLLPSLDRIFGLYTIEARALLKHHCEKYGDEPIFRLGIQQYIQSQLAGILESTANDPLGLTPEDRRFLLSVYEKHAVLNIAEKRLLAMSCWIDVETVRMFWDDMDLKREAWSGMRKLVAARELEGMRAEKLDVKLKGQRDEMRKRGREFDARVERQREELLRAGREFGFR